MPAPPRGRCSAQGREVPGRTRQPPRSAVREEADHRTLQRAPAPADAASRQS